MTKASDVGANDWVEEFLSIGPMTGKGGVIMMMLKNGTIYVVRLMMTMREMILSFIPNSPDLQFKHDDGGDDHIKTSVHQMPGPNDWVGGI